MTLFTGNLSNWHHSKRPRCCLHQQFGSSNEARFTRCTLLQQEIQLSTMIIHVKWPFKILSTQAHFHETTNMLMKYYSCEEETGYRSDAVPCWLFEDVFRLFGEKPKPIEKASKLSLLAFQNFPKQPFITFDSSILRVFPNDDAVRAATVCSI